MKYYKGKSILVIVLCCVTFQLFNRVTGLILTGLDRIKICLEHFLPVNLKSLCELQHIVVVVEHGGDAHCEVIL